MAAKKQEKINELEQLQDIPDETKKKLEQIKVKLEKYKDKVLERFEEYILGISLLPPSKDEEDKEKINVLLLIDDTDSTKMSKEELREKLSGIMIEQAHKIDKSLNPEVLLLSELWQNCYDAKYELLGVIANSAPIYDRGMLQAIKISEIHKTMVLKKFEKYIVSYVLAGSLVQGKATPESDIDVFIVIDDTDVKKMTRAELKDKLRAIIIGMGIDAGKMTGIENKINIQVYILTDFWENIKEANPVIFTFLRDGIPLYDRGIFMPWKQLLQMGRVKPSPEAIDMFMHTGDQMLERVKYKLKEIGTEDFFWSTLTPSQAALMMYGLPPPTPKETPEVLREIFVKKEKMLEDKYVKIMEKILKVRKDIEHGTKKEISGKELDELYQGSQEYLERMKKLFLDIEKLKQDQDYEKIFEDITITAKNLIELEGIKINDDKNLEKDFKKALIESGKFSNEELKQFKETMKAKEAYKKGKLSKADSINTMKSARILQRTMIEQIQRIRSRELEKAKLRVKYGNNKYGEIIILKDNVYIINDIDEPDKEIQHAKMSKEGKLNSIKESSLQDLEAEIVNTNVPEKKFLKPEFFEELRKIFGKDIELLVNY
ncbi:nucleotidyltransferase domain-containing protein [Candidatus Woesearchaeota archaeon]|nr:nucleotidyltransferase domain-containing protein [Candidatus Woesearchaeota archaeon]MCF7901179.1 nucleotidyltransferase domain-containing protein [Candidatus Woesearchaeota archaeon]MCF8013807.1 nucleotidyltransferase domain-containing protein [Candidatus Woesearchaeota archaeon]